MRRGTTPTLKFNMPYTATMVQSGFITFVQRGAKVVDREFPDSSVTVTDRAISIELTQAETLAMTTADVCRAQIRLILTSGKRVASNVVRFPVEEILKDGEI